MAKRRVARESVIQPQDQSIRYIALTKKQVAIVDASDYEWLSQWNWHAIWSAGMGSFYAARMITIDGVQHLTQMHREIMGLQRGDPREVDHKMSGQTLDNRRDNLRVVSHMQNQHNRRTNRNSTSGFPGVHLFKPNGKYASSMVVNSKKVHLGYYFTAEEAHEVRKRRIEEVRGAALA